MTQIEANELFEGPRLDMASRIANTGNLFLVSIFFHPLLPITIPIALIGFIFSYWVDKVIIINLNHIDPLAKKA